MGLERLRAEFHFLSGCSPLTHTLSLRGNKPGK